MNVYLRELQLKNFQSWENEHISFSDGLNCIIARNGVGKSVIYKALQITVLPNKYSREDRRDFIRGSAQFAEIYYLFSDNSLYIVKFSETNIQYVYCEDFVNNPNNISLVGNTPPNDLIDKLELIFRGDMLGNLISMNQNLFLVDSNESDDFNLFNILLTHENTSKLIDSLSNFVIPRAIKYRDKCEDKYSNLSKCLNLLKVEDIDGLKDKINLGEKYERVLTPLDNYLIEADSLKEPERNKYNIEIKDIKGCYIVDKFLDYSERISKPVVVSENIFNLLNVVNKVNNLCEFIDKNSFSLLKPNIKNIEAISPLIRHLEKTKDMIKLDEEIEYNESELQQYDGEKYECPIYGTIKLINQECIPFSD